jgi:transmembrane sensor
LTIPDDRREQAAAWFSAQRRGALSTEEHAQLESWRADPDNQAALEGMQGLWDELDGLKGVAHASVRHQPNSQRESNARHESNKTWPLALAACLLVAVAGGVWWHFQHLHGSMGAYTVQTAIGEQRSATLPDGSKVDLNVVTHLDYRLSSGRRDVRLSEGEALFFVRKDTAHPFIVRTGAYEVRALGTAFDVSSRDGGVQVTVLEGLVSVEAVAGPQAGRTLTQLTPGQKISLAADTRGASSRPVKVERISLQAVAEWREHTVSYENVPIAQIVADMNRFYPRPLRVPDPALATRRVMLLLQVQDREQTLQTLSALLGTQLRNDGEADALVGPK